MNLATCGLLLSASIRKRRASVRYTFISRSRPSAAPRIPDIDRPYGAQQAFANQETSGHKFMAIEQHLRKAAKRLLSGCIRTTYLSRDCWFQGRSFKSTHAKQNKWSFTVDEDCQNSPIGSSGATNAVSEHYHLHYLPLLRWLSVCEGLVEEQNRMKRIQSQECMNTWERYRNVQQSFPHLFQHATCNDLLAHVTSLLD